MAASFFWPRKATKKIQNTKYQPRIARINTDRTGLPMPAGWSLKENRSVRIRVIRGLYSVFFVSLRVISWPLNIAAGNQSVYTCLPAKAGPCNPWPVFCIFSCLLVCFSGPSLLPLAINPCISVLSVACILYFPCRFVSFRGHLIFAAGKKHSWPF